MSRLPRWPVLALAAPALACHSLDRFDTEGEAAYCGAMVAGPSFNAGFLPKGVPPLLSLKLPRATGQLTSLPGTLSSDDAALGLCSGGGQPLFQSSPLRAIPEIYHDTLSTLSFGEGHDDDFFAWADSTCQGTVLSLVSLLRGGDVEVRLFKPAPLPPPDAGPDKSPGYAVFYLKRREHGC